MAISSATPTRARRRRKVRLGGVRGNEVLTRLTAALLLVLLAALGITILSIEGLVRPHMFIGLVLIPPVLLKLATTGYRFARYYAGSRAYREKGPPPLILRLTAPVLVVATVAVFATGVWLMALGHGSDSVVGLHSASALVWIVVFAIHVAAHIRTVARELGSDWASVLRRSFAGSDARAMLLVGALGAGLLLALSSLGLITGWHGE